MRPDLKQKFLGFKFLIEFADGYEFGKDTKF